MAKTKAETTDVSRPPTYATVLDAPPHLRMVQQARLSVDQINGIQARAYELAYMPEDAPEGSAPIPHRGKAIAEFIEANQIADGFWVPKNDDDAQAEASEAEASEAEAAQAEKETE